MDGAGNSILTGEQLITLRLKGNTVRDLPIVGQKDFQPNHSWLENKQIQNALSERKALIQEERVEKWSSLSSAEWIPTVKMAKVSKKVGKVWESFGHHSDDADWLYPEEALLLLETNALELIYNSLPMSVERGYVDLLGNEAGCTLNEYRTYSHLVRLGYKLFRHSAEISVTRYEKEIRLDQHVLNQKQKNKTNNAASVPNLSAVSETSSSRIVSQADENLEDIAADSENVQQNQANEKSRRNIINLDVDDSLSSDVVPVTSEDKSSDASIAKPIEILIDDDDDDDVVEIRVNKDVVVLDDTSSSGSDSDEEDDDSASNGNDKTDDNESDTSQRSNSNWKRSARPRQSVTDNLKAESLSCPTVRKHYCTIKEFLADSIQNQSNVDCIVLSDDEGQSTSNSRMEREIHQFYKEIEVIDVDSDQDDFANIRNLSRKDILDSFPIFNNGEGRVKIPRLSLLPPNVKPFRQEYQLRMGSPGSASKCYNDWRDHKTSLNNSNTRPSGNVPHRQFNSRPYQSNRNRMVLPFYRQQQPWNMYNNNSNLQNQIHAMATGVMQVASTLLSLPFVSHSFNNMPALMQANTNQQFFGQFNNAYQPIRYLNPNNTINTNTFLQDPALNNPNINNFMPQPQRNLQFRGSYSCRPNLNANNYNDQNNRNTNNYTQFDSCNRPVNNPPNIYNRFDNNATNSPHINDHFNRPSVIGNVGPPSAVDNAAENSNQMRHSVDNRNVHNIDSNHQYQRESMQSENVMNNGFENRQHNTNNKMNRCNNRYSGNNSFNPVNRFRNQKRHRFFGRPVTKRPNHSPSEEQMIVVDNEGDPSVFRSDIPYKDTFSHSDFIPLSNNRVSDNHEYSGSNDSMGVNYDSPNDNPSRNQSEFQKRRNFRGNWSKKRFCQTIPSVYSDRLPNKRIRFDDTEMTENDIEIVKVSSAKESRRSRRQRRRALKRKGVFILGNDGDKIQPKKLQTSKNSSGSAACIDLVDLEPVTEPVKVKDERSTDVKVEKEQNEIPVPTVLPCDESSRQSLTSCTSTSSSAQIVKTEPALAESVQRVQESSQLIPEIKAEHTVTKTEPNSGSQVSTVTKNLESNSIKQENLVKLEKERPKEIVKTENNAFENITSSSSVKVEPSLTSDVADSSNDQRTNPLSRDNTEDHNMSVSSEPDVRSVDLTWAQLKKDSLMTTNVEARSPANGIESSDVIINETEDILPLVTSRDCSSFRSVLSALQIVGGVESCDFENNDVQKLKISFDVYVPKTVAFKKSSRGLPDYRLVVVGFRDAFPTSAEIAELNYRYEDNIPILVAMVLPDSVSFCAIGTVNLPTLIEL